MARGAGCCGWTCGNCIAVKSLAVVDYNIPLGILRSHRTQNLPYSLRHNHIHQHQHVLYLTTPSRGHFHLSTSPACTALSPPLPRQERSFLTTIDTSPNTYLSRQVQRSSQFPHSCLNRYFQCLFAICAFLTAINRRQELPF
jgi:hypothetical protein